MDKRKFYKKKKKKAEERADEDIPQMQRKAHYQIQALVSISKLIVVKE